MSGQLRSFKIEIIFNFHRQIYGFELSVPDISIKIFLMIV